uniref:40S ribosomal protein SA n=1 Tax=Otolemur garnettii TaxID=30611 RepID=H0XLS2_OTOGA
LSSVTHEIAWKEEALLKFLSTGTHLDGTNHYFQMEKDIYKRKSDGVYIINLRRTWKKLLLTAYAIVANVSVISSRNTGQQAVLNFAAATGATPIPGSFCPRAFTSQIQAAIQEPCLLVVTNPRADHQPLTEVPYVKLPTIALCYTDSLRSVDIAIPDLMWQMLAQEVLRMHSTTSCEHLREVMPDLGFYRDPEEIEKGQQAAAEESQGERTGPAPEFTAAQAKAADWTEGQVPAVPTQQFPTEEWSAAPSAQATEWVGTTTEWS